ncbi:MAG: hypothetical protein MJ200_03495 [Mycoplasmoidaceae bacterium]|nr:hypothetical protein [Mycoplasmoidaceae bacterium]
MVVLCFLLPVGLYDSTKFDPAFLFKGSNAFFHLITPIIGVVSLLLFEDIKQIKYPQTLFSLIFVLVYEIFYTVDYFVQFMPEDGAHSHD